MLRTSLAMVLVLAAAAPARAERGLTLDDALALARRGSRDLQQAKARLEQSAVGVEQAWVSLLPTLALQGKYTHNYKEVAVDFSVFGDLAIATGAGLTQLYQNAKLAPSPPVQDALGKLMAASQSGSASQFTSSSGPVVIQKEEQLDGSATLTVPLVVPWAYLALDSAKRSKDAADANYRVTETQVLYAAAQAFYAAAGTDELVVARRHAIEVAEETLKNAQTRFAAGVVNRTEVTRAELALVRARQQLTEALDGRGQAYRSLATLIDLREPFHVVAGDLSPRARDTAEGLGQLALRLRPEFTAYAKTIDASSATASSAGWRWAPTLSGFATAHVGNYQGFSGDLYSWAVGVQLDWLIYDGGARDAQRHLAAAQRRESEAKLSLLRDQIGDEIANAASSLETRRQALDTAVRSVELSQETLKLVRVQHEAGTATQLDLLQAQDALVAAEVGVAQARFDLALASLNLERAAGTFPADRSRP